MRIKHACSGLCRTVCGPAGLCLHLWQVKALAVQSCLTLCDPMDCSPPGSSVHGILQARILDWVAMPSSMGGLPDPGIEPRSPTLQADSLPSEPPGKPASSFRCSLFLQYFPDDPVVQILCFHCRGCGFNPWLRQWRSHMPFRKNNQSLKQKQFCNKFNKDLKKKGFDYLRLRQSGSFPNYDLF